MTTSSNGGETCQQISKRLVGDRRVLHVHTKNYQTKTK
jgi:hypothetical protein